MWLLLDNPTSFNRVRRRARILSDLGEHALRARFSYASSLYMGEKLHLVNLENRRAYHVGIVVRVGRGYSIYFASRTHPGTAIVWSRFRERKWPGRPLPLR